MMMEVFGREVFNQRQSFWLIRFKRPGQPLNGCWPDRVYIGSQTDTSYPRIGSWRVQDFSLRIIIIQGGLVLDAAIICLGFSWQSWWYRPVLNVKRLLGLASLSLSLSLAQLMDHKTRCSSSGAVKDLWRGLVLCYKRCITHKRGPFGQRQAYRNTLTNQSRSALCWLWFLYDRCWVLLILRFFSPPATSDKVGAAPHTQHARALGAHNGSERRIRRRKGLLSGF